MARLHRVTKELIFLACLCGIATFGMFMAGHERRWLLLLLTGLMVLLMGLAQLGYRKSVRTLKGVRGRRKRSFEGKSI